MKIPVKDVSSPPFLVWVWTRQPLEMWQIRRIEDEFDYDRYKDNLTIGGNYES